MSARNVCNGTRPSRLVSVRAISEPFRRPEMRTLIPNAPDRMVLVTARFMARRNITRFSSCCEIPSATSFELGLSDLGDVQAHVLHGHAENLGDSGAELLDVLALLADHDAGPRGVDRDVGAA